MINPSGRVRPGVARLCPRGRRVGGQFELGGARCGYTVWWDIWTDQGYWKKQDN